MVSSFISPFDNQDIPPLKRRNGNGLAETETEELNGQFTNVFSKTSE